MCQPKTISARMAACNCGCCGCGPSIREFVSTEEELKRLKQQRDQLESELAGIRDKINRLS